MIRERLRWPAGRGARTAALAAAAIVPLAAISGAGVGAAQTPVTAPNRAPAAVTVFPGQKSGLLPPRD